MMKRILQMKKLVKKLNNKVINILGTEYTILFKKEEDDEKLTICDGYCDFSSKEIVCGIFERTIDSYKDIERYAKGVLRHEIIHGFLYESGLDGNSNDIKQWARNEEMVDWMALQIPKIKKVYDELKLC